MAASRDPDKSKGPGGMTMRELHELVRVLSLTMFVKNLILCPTSSCRKPKPNWLCPCW